MDGYDGNVLAGTPKPPSISHATYPDPSIPVVTASYRTVASHQKQRCTILAVELRNHAVLGINAATVVAGREKVGYG